MIAQELGRGAKLLKVTRCGDTGSTPIAAWTPLRESPGIGFGTKTSLVLP